MPKRRRGASNDRSPTIDRRRKALYQSVAPALWTLWENSSTSVKDPGCDPVNKVLQIMAIKKSPNYTFRLTKEGHAIIVRE